MAVILDKAEFASDSYVCEIAEIEPKIGGDGIAFHQLTVIVRDRDEPSRFVRHMAVVPSLNPSDISDTISDAKYFIGEQIKKNAAQ